MYKTESTLGLIGSILAAIFTALSVVGALIAVFFIDYFGPWVFDLINNFAHVNDWELIEWSYSSFTGLASVVLTLCVGVGVIIALASVILGFLGTSKLKKDDKNGGVMLIVAAALAFLSVIGLVPFVLMLIGGIMAVSKKQTVAPQAGIEKPL